MSGMEEKTLDLRIRRTRRLLQQAFLTLMTQKSFQDITVQDITTTAMVNRSTFYDHFVDKYALLEYTLSQQFREELAGKLPDPGRYSTENLRALIITMCEFIGHLHGTCLSADEQNIVRAEPKIVKFVKEILADWLSDTAPAESAVSGAGELAVTIASWAIYGSAHHWSEGKPKGNITEFAQQVAQVIEGTLKGRGSTAAST